MQNSRCWQPVFRCAKRLLFFRCLSPFFSLSCLYRVDVLPDLRALQKSMSGAGALPTVPEGALRPLQTSMSPATSSIDEVLTRGLAKIEESMQQKLDSVRQELGAQISALQNEMTINSALHAEGP